MLCISHPYFFRDFFPVIITFLRQLPFIGQFLNLPFIRPVCIHPRSLPESSHALSRGCYVPLGRGSFSRLTHFCSMTVTTLLFYCSDLSGQHSCYCSCQCQVLFDTGYRKWLNKRRASLSRLSPDNSFEIIRRSQHQIFFTHKYLLSLSPILAPLQR